MITEPQRRALFALREALRLCDDARIMVSLNEDCPGLILEAPNFEHSVFVFLAETDIDMLLSEHPEQ